MINNIIRCFVGIVFFICFASCNQDEVYYKFTPIPQNEWSKQDEISFVLDSLSINPTHKYNISLEITYNLNYPYKNLYLYIEHTLQDSISKCDTVECVLIDDFGRWQGGGNGATRQLSVLYKTNLMLDATLHNKIDIYHAMQDSELKGIERVGLRVY